MKREQYCLPVSDEVASTIEFKFSTLIKTELPPNVAYDILWAELVKKAKEPQ